MGGAYSILNVHIVFSTKHQDPLIDQYSYIEPELHRYISGMIPGDECGQKYVAPVGA